MNITFKLRNIGSVLVVASFFTLFATASDVKAQDLLPGAMSPNQALAVVAESLPAGVTLSTATPQQIQTAVYSATRTNPQSAGVIVGAVRTAVPSAASAAAQGASTAVNDAVGSGEVNQGAAVLFNQQVQQNSAPQGGSSGAGGQGGGGGFFPSANTTPAATVSPGTSSVTSVQSGG